MMFDKQNIHLHCLEISKRIKDFLLAKKSREFLIFLFFILVSFSFWLLQVLNDEYETELSIPIRMKQVPENVVLTSSLPSEMKVSVKDRGTVLVNYLWGQNLYPLVIDFSEYSDKGTQVRIPSMSLLPKNWVWAPICVWARAKRFPAAEKEFRSLPTVWSL